MTLTAGSGRGGGLQGHNGFALRHRAYLAFLGPGAIVGELSVIDGLPRSASGAGVRDAALSFLSRATFEEFAQEHPEIYKSLVTAIENLFSTNVIHAEADIVKAAFCAQDHIIDRRSGRKKLIVQRLATDIHEEAAMISSVKKRSIIIRNHKTSISLEDNFWACLRQIARERGTTASKLIGMLDAERNGANLSSTIRVFVLDYYRNNVASNQMLPVNGEVRNLPMIGISLTG